MHASDIHYVAKKVPTKHIHHIYLRQVTLSAQTKPSKERETAIFLFAYLILAWSFIMSIT